MALDEEDLEDILSENPDELKIKEEVKDFSSEDFYEQAFGLEEELPEDE